jgi:putative DNA primase/helicase
VVADAGAIAQRLAEGGQQPTRDAVRQSFLRAAKGDTDGQNASDYVVDRSAWLRTGDPQALPMTARETRGQAIMRIAAETAARLGQRLKALRHINVPAYLKAALQRRSRTPTPTQPVPTPVPTQTPPQARRPTPQPSSPGLADPTRQSASDRRSPLRPRTTPAQATRTWTKISEADARAQFREVLAAAGFDVARLKGPELDGQRHYAPLKEDRGRQQRGAYRVYYDGTRPAGAWWNHHTGEVGTWKAEGERVALDPAEADKIARRQAALVAQRERERVQREGQGARTAQRIWDTARPATSAHPYVAAKGIDPAGLRVTDDNRLVVPLTLGGKLVNVQTISADGTKRPVYGARKVGAHFVVGTIEAGQPIAFAEGLATAKSFHAATGLATVMAMDTSNLMPVAEAARKAYPTTPFVFAADNDAHLPKRAGPRQMPNVGVDKARDAAVKVGNAIVVTAPELPERTARDAGTDWNDVAVARGAQAARDASRQMMAAHAIAQEQTKQALAQKNAPEPTAARGRKRGPEMSL